MAKKTIRCKIVTPTEVMFDDEASYVTVPAWDGKVGLMAGQSPMLTRLGIGSMRVDLPEQGSRWYLVDRGFLQVQDDVATVLTESAWSSADIDAAEAEAELTDANARAVAGGEDREQVEGDQARARAKRSLAASGAGRS